MTVPEALFDQWIEPLGFAESLSLQMKRHQESFVMLHRAIVLPGEDFNPSTIKTWASGRSVPRSVKSIEMLTRIELRYRLPDGYFSAKMPHQGQARLGHVLPGITRAEQRRLTWHLPDDFNQRSALEQAEILEWVRTVVISGATEYRRYQAEAMKLRYGIRFEICRRSQDCGARAREKVGRPARARIGGCGERRV